MRINFKQIIRSFFVFSLFTVHCSLFTDHCRAFAGTAGKVNSGNSYFKKKKYDKSLEKYRDAQITDPDNPAIHYNTANALHKMQNYDEAASEYNKALSVQDIRVKGAVYYNLGNNEVMKGENDKALDYYKKALETNPNDEDAKYNYEFLKNMKPQKQQNKGQGSGDKDKKDKNKDKDKNQDKQQAQEKEDKNKMSKEDAKRILQYFDESDKNSAKKRKMKMPQIPKVEEDW